MNTNLSINPEVKTAIIYSLDDLVAYSVEIVDGDNIYYVAKNDEPVLFGNMLNAKRAALKEKAATAYLALRRTYDETSLNDHSHYEEKYDYSPVDLNY